MLLFGLGGVYTEILRDTTIRLLPIDASDAWQAIDTLRASAILHQAAARALLPPERGGVRVLDAKAELRV